MSHTYSNILLHYIFSTHGREKILSPEIRQRLWPYMAGIALENKMKAIAVGGTADHAHLLLSLPTTMASAKAIQLIKAGSSKWISETLPGFRNFQWQVGYGVFSVDGTQMQAILEYIRNQEEHHRLRTFQEEYVGFLKEYGIIYDEKYLWD